MSTVKTKKKLGVLIRDARRSIGISQKDLAHKLKLSDKTVSSYEVGRALPNFQVLKDISKALHKPIAYFDEDGASDDLDLRIKLNNIERELLEIRKMLEEKKIDKRN